MSETRLQRPLVAIALAFLCTVAVSVVAAAPASLDTLTSNEAAGGLRAALAKGIDVAVAQLGAKGGFLNDPKVAIPLPPALEKADRALRMLGMGADADNLRAAMNRAAEAAVAQSKPVFQRALQHMSVADAKGILTGGNDAGTEYFRRTTGTELATSFKPTVARETAKLKLAASYDQYAGKAAQLHLISAKDANLNDYVTQKALDGLFSRVADEEREIRKDPLGQASSLIKKVFGAIH